MGRERMKLPRRLAGRKGVVLDTMVFIYLFEDSPQFGSVSEFIIEQGRLGKFESIVTPVTAAEIMLKPLQNKRYDLADRYRLALRSMQNVVPVALSFETGLLAGSLRAKYGLPLPDMIQVACAMQSKPPTLITNDKAMEQMEEAEVFLLSAFL
jgi:predicted nucleic acid-binding protein